jgi:hypothetical protein
MKKILAAMALAGLAGLTACAPAAEPPVETSAPKTESSSPSIVSPSPSAAGTLPAAGAPPASGATPAARAAGVKESCEKFNSLFAEYGAADGTDENAFEGIYLRSKEAKEAAPEEVSGLFAALSLLAIDRAGVAAEGGEPEQESKDAIRDAVFANAGACTAEGVTLRL